MTKELTLEGFNIGYKNFSGKGDRFNKEGDRNFVVFLDEDTAKRLTEEGWNVRYPKPSEDSEYVRNPYLKVKVNYGGRPPRIVTVTNGQTMVLNEELVSTLDALDLMECDLVISPYHWNVNGSSGITAYLKTLYANVESDPFQHKYLNQDGDLPFL